MAIIILQLIIIIACIHKIIRIDHEFVLLYINLDEFIISESASTSLGV